jgi:hypothetical protein
MFEDFWGEFSGISRDKITFVMSGVFRDNTLVKNVLRQFWGRLLYEFSKGF